MFKSIPRDDFLGFLKYSGVLVGNSSSGMIEASYFKIPIINIGIRQNGREKGKNVISLIKPNHISLQKSLVRALNMKKSTHSDYQKIYGEGNSSEKIIDLLEKIRLEKN